MQGDERVVETLQEVLTDRLTATGQDDLHAATRRECGSTLLARRILFLGGRPGPRAVSEQEHPALQVGSGQPH